MVVSLKTQTFPPVPGFADHEVRDGLAGDEVEVRCVWAWLAAGVDALRLQAVRALTAVTFNTTASSPVARHPSQPVTFNTNGAPVPRCVADLSAPLPCRVLRMRDGANAK